MEAKIDALLDSLADLREKANVDAVFGKPVTAEGHTVIPVAQVAYEFEMGVEGEPGESAESGGWGGGGVSARPLAVIDVGPKVARVGHVVDEQRLALAGVALIGWAVFWLAWALVRIFGQEE